jgi:hypothetical protein
MPPGPIECRTVLTLPHQGGGERFEGAAHDIPTPVGPLRGRIQVGEQCHGLSHPDPPSAGGKELIHGLTIGYTAHPCGADSSMGTSAPQAV